MVNIPGKSFLPVIFCACFIAALPAGAQPLHGARSFTRQDTLRGSLSLQRTWWDVTKYDITVQPDYDSKTIRGKNIISYSITSQRHTDTAQVDLQEPMIIDSVFAGTVKTSYTRNGNAFFVYIPKQGNTTTG